MVHNDTGQNEEPAWSVVVLYMWEGNSIKRAIRECITSYCYLFHRFKRGMFRMRSTTVDRKDLWMLLECRSPLVIPKSSVLSDELQLLGSLRLCIMIEISWYSLTLNISTMALASVSHIHGGSCTGYTWCWQRWIPSLATSGSNRDNNSQHTGQLGFNTAKLLSWCLLVCGTVENSKGKQYWVGFTLNWWVFPPVVRPDKCFCQVLRSEHFQ